MKQYDLNAPELYLNRDLSMLGFHRRVFEMACDPEIPLLERLRFLCISASNLDEFFEVRVAVHKDRLEMGVNKRSPDGLTPAETLASIRTEVLHLVDDQYALLNRELLPALEQEGIRFIRRTEWNAQQAAWVSDYFHRHVKPLLTPISLDPAHPFPRLLNKILNFIVALEGKDAFGRDLTYAVVQMPRPLPRVVGMPADIGGVDNSYVFLSSIIHAHVDELFPGMKVKSCHQFRVTRNSELIVDEEEVEDLKKALAGELLERRYSEPVRLEVSVHCPAELSDFLLDQFGLQQEDLYRVDGPVNLYRLSAVCDEVERPELKFPPFMPGLPRHLQQEGEREEADLFALVREGDVLLHHPFQSFAPVVELLKQAAADPKVLAIKQTLYRVVPNSPIVDALVRAARAGKDVVAIIELRARFNEEDNIILADRLHAAGAHVVYGVVGFKTHGKMMLIVRKEEGGLRRYVHLGTGNYHTITSRIYTDFGLLTCKREIGEDVHQLFQQLTGMGRASRLKSMLQAPFSLHSGLIERIELEAENARQGGKGKIVAKMNGLEEPEIIRALYRASQAGVKIELIVRGICCLRPGVPGVSDNIRVRSVLGRFLEHTRVYYFHNGGKPEVFCASADWMTRNLLRRVETCFPVEEKQLQRRVFEEGLRLYTLGNAGTWQLKRDGSYQRIKPRGALKSAQQALMEKLGTLYYGS